LIYSRFKNVSGGFFHGLQNIFGGFANDFQNRVGEITHDFQNLIGGFIQDFQNIFGGFTYDFQNIFSGFTHVRFEVFTAVTMKNGVFWVLTRATRRNNPEDTILRFTHDFSCHVGQPEISNRSSSNITHASILACSVAV
jgi:hypothetical protein